MKIGQLFSFLDKPDRTTQSQRSSLITPDHNTPPAELEKKPAPDTLLIAACLHGDASAWDHLVDTYGRLVYAVASRYPLSPGEVDDVFQAVFITVLKSLDSLAMEPSLGVWLIHVTQREADGRTRGKRRGVPEQDGLDGSETTAHSVRHLLLQEQVHLALAQLDPLEREFLLACMAEPAPSDTELTRRFGMQEGDIGSARAHCLKKLEAILLTMGIADFA